MEKEGLFIAWSRPLSEWSRQVLICDFIKDTSPAFNYGQEQFNMENS
jgi:hypothetical protein